jgi:cobalt-zinc-cadmium efflux system outer membrane protein
MIRNSAVHSSVLQVLIFCLCLVAGATLRAGAYSAEPPAIVPESMPTVLSRDAAVRWALAYNPELAALRQQHGIAAAGVIIAQTYPFNPVWTNKLFADNGPESAGVTNRLSMEQRISIDLELYGQGRHRRAGARAALSRTDWEIAFQEEGMAIRVVRAFNALLYQRGRLRLGEETIRLGEKTVETVRAFVQGGRRSQADLVLARTEVDDARAQLSSVRVSEVRARQDLLRLLGVTDRSLTIQGTLDPLPKPADREALRSAALERRADLHARQAAVAEAEARLRLVKADRFGNPNLGPDYEYNETRVNFIGAQLTLPLPVINTHRGEILQREAELTRAGLELRQAEVAVEQDLAAALARLNDAQRWADSYRDEVLPNLQKSVATIEQLFESGDPTVDVLRVLSVRRVLLKARDGYLTALYEVSQAQADLAAAVGDAGLAAVP